jgi:hypothetical protein
MPTGNGIITNLLSSRDPIIKLAVGIPPKYFHAHKSILCKSSAFFKRKLEPEWPGLPYPDTTGLFDTIKLPKDSPEIVAQYVQWLGTKELRLTLLKKTTPCDPVFAQGAADTYVWLAKAYVFGEKIDDGYFKNAILW